MADLRSILAGLLCLSAYGLLWLARRVYPAAYNDMLHRFTDEYLGPDQYNDGC